MEHPLPGHAAATPRPARDPAALTRRREDRDFARMAAAFAPHGGLPGADEVLRRLRRHAPLTLSTFARALAGRDVLSLSRGPELLVPMFQFDPADMSPRPGVVAVLGELRTVFDDWALAAWFATPNDWLFEAAPVDLVALRPADVLRAARADRCVAQG